MCGIALILSGVRIDITSLLPNLVNSTPQAESEQPLFQIEDLEAALRRRGPDSLGTKKVVLYSNISSSVEEHDILSFVEGEEAKTRDLWCCNKTGDCSSVGGETWELNNGFGLTKTDAELHLIGATLQLRGIKSIIQPLVDACGNILVYNGEVFGGIPVGADSNDAEFLLQSLGNCCSCSSHEHSAACYQSGKGQNSVPELLSKIRGPWALIYWQDGSSKVWFGRDAFGRRSLLVHWPTLEDSRLLLSSVSPPSFSNTSSDFGDENGMNELNFWEELSCGVYSIVMGASGKNGHVVGDLKKHEWCDPFLKELITWERISVDPKLEDLCISHVKVPKEHDDIHSCHSTVPSELGSLQMSISLPSHRVLVALKESMMRRTALYTNFQVVQSENRQQNYVPVAVLFSGGLDSMILAALLDQCLDPKYEIDLLNVSFDGHSAPDRISARSGIKELKRIAPLRRWKLVEIDADLSKLNLELKHVMALISPANTYMDLNIGIALWLAAGGDGWVYEEIDNNNDEKFVRAKYKSEAKILLVGSGADEQCAGYGRHKTKYRHGSWLALHEEMRLDMQRIWKRNLGRDDRCLSDNGKEARFPFLDEDVIRMMLDIPLWEIADLDQPSGIGDKKILREVACLLGLFEAAVLPKRAIQFGSRIARESNRINFGSNRAANQASAGSVPIHRS